MNLRKIQDGRRKIENNIKENLDHLDYTNFVEKQQIRYNNLKKTE